MRLLNQVEKLEAAAREWQRVGPGKGWKKVNSQLVCTRAAVEDGVRGLASTVAEQCAQECDRLANNYGSEKRDFAEAIRALFPKP
jgi:hypothetical protein